MKRDEIEAIERVLRDRDVEPRDYVFCSERGAKLSRYAFWRIVSDAGKRAGLPMKAYVHQLRHGCGYYLANKGCDLRLIQDYLGHRQIHYVPRRTMSCRAVRQGHERMRGQDIVGGSTGS